MKEILKLLRYQECGGENHFWLIVFFASLVMLPLPAMAETKVFSETFDDIDRWSLDSGWSVVKENGNSMLKGENHFLVQGNFPGVIRSVELKLKIETGSVHLNVRTKETEGGQSRYFIGLGGGHGYIKKELVNRFEDLIEGGQGVSLGQWHKIKINISDNTINVFVDGAPFLSAEDRNLLTEGDVSFETLDDTVAYIDDVNVELEMPGGRVIDAKELFRGGEHRGDITLEGGDVLVLEEAEYRQFGNIYLKDVSKLVIKNAVLKIERYQRLLNHWGIFLDGLTSMEVENSRLVPGDGALFIVYARGASRVTMRDSPTKIHLFSVFDKSKAEVENSEIIYDIGGLVGAYGHGTVKIKNSKIGAINLHIPRGASLTAEGLGTGFFRDWNLQRDLSTSGINSNIILENTELVPDKVGPGPFERGFPVFIESGAKVKIRNSEVRKVVINLENESAEFGSFYLEKPSNFKYKGIELENVTVKGQWGVFLRRSANAIVRDSDAFWTFIYDDSKLTLVNTRMNEFDPRNFHGEIVFKNSSWDTAAEIIDNNDFTMQGDIRIGDIGGFSWENSTVTRIYTFVGEPETELGLEKDGNQVWSGKTDKNGGAEFSIKFDDSNFNDRWLLKSGSGKSVEIMFLSETPVRFDKGASPWFVVVFVLVLLIALMFILKKGKKHK